MLGLYGGKLLQFVVGVARRSIDGESTQRRLLLLLIIRLVIERATPEND